MMMLATAGSYLRGVVVIASIFLIGAQYSPSQAPTQATDLIEKLPRCSVLRTELEHGRHGDGVSRPYVARMQESGVERALFELQAVLHKGRPADIQITRRLYFRKFDAPNSQVSDNADLAMLATRLQPELDESALARVSKAPILRGFRGCAGRGVARLLQVCSSSAGIVLPRRTSPLSARFDRWDGSKPSHSLPQIAQRHVPNISIWWQ